MEIHRLGIFDCETHSPRNSNFDIINKNFGYIGKIISFKFKVYID